MTCPRECQVRLDHLEETDRASARIHEGIWEELKMKVHQKLFFWLVGIAVFVLLAAFGTLYNQGSTVQSALHSVQIDVAKAQAQLESLDKKASRRDRASSRTRHTDNPSDPL